MSKNILFVTEKWCDADPNKGPTNHFHNLFATAKQSGLFDRIDNLFLEDAYNANRTIDYDIYNYVLDSDKKPDLVFFSYLGDSPLNPTFGALSYLCSENIPLLFLWPDITYDWAIQRIKSVDDYATCHVLWDGRGLSEVNPKHFYTWTPQDTNLFYPIPWHKKDIDVSFLGSRADHYEERGPCLNFLKKELGDKLFISGGQREDKLSPVEYADLMRRSKITINFNRSPKPVSHQFQCKGRVFEALASNTLLLEPAISPTYTLTKLISGYHYLNYHTPQDILYHIRGCLSDLFRTETIATTGNIYFRQHLNNTIFWQNILNKVFINERQT